MSNRCVACGKGDGMPLRGLEVRTLHVRSLGGENRVQALGDFCQGAVCPDCAQARLDLERDAWKSARPRVIRFGAVLAAGVLFALAALWWLGGQRVFVLLGLAAVACGILGIWGVLRDSRDRSRELAALSPQDALEEAAWAVFVDHLPAKEGDNTLTYIPVNDRSLRRKNGDLMILYRLLPAIAKEAYQRIHGQAATPDAQANSAPPKAPEGE